MRASSVCRRAAASAAALVLLLSVPFMSAGVGASPVAPPTGAQSGAHRPVYAPPPIVSTRWFKVTRLCLPVCVLTPKAGSSVAFIVTAESLIHGMPWETYTGHVSFSSSDPQATLPGGYTYTGDGPGKDQGTHTFSATFRTAGPQTLTVFQTSAPTMDGTSNPVTMIPAPSHHTTFVVQPGGATVGSPLATQPVVEVRDQFENRTASTAAVTLSLVPPAGSAGAALTCMSGTTVAAVAGTAAYSGCSVDRAGDAYTMVATTPTLLSGTSAPFTITAGPAPTPTPSPSPTPGPVGTLLLTGYSPYLNNNAIDWGKYIDLTTTAPAGTAFQIQVTTDRSSWTTLADANATPLTFTIGSSGAYTYRYTPIRNYWYRSVAGSTMTDGALRVTVRQTIAIRPQSPVTVNVASGTSVTFSATVRPARPELQKANVVFQLYRKSGGSWMLSKSATVVIDDSGVARQTFTFTSGSWRIRAQAQPTPVNANSFWTPYQSYSAS